VKSTYANGQTPKGFAALNAMSAQQQASSQWQAMYLETLVAAANYGEAVDYWETHPALHTNAAPSTLERVVIAYREISQFEKGSTILEQALIRPDLTEQQRVGLLEQQANAAIMRGELKPAFDLLGELVIEAKRLEMLDSLTVFLYNRANIGRAIGQFTIARDSILEALQLTNQAGHVVRGAWMQTILGMLQTDLGEYQAAETTLLEARDIHLRQNFPSAISSCAEALTRLYCIWQQPYSAFMARKYSHEALLRTEQTPMGLTLGLMGAAQVELKYGTAESALELSQQALDVVIKNQVAPLEAAAYLLRGKIHQKLLQSDAAQADLNTALLHSKNMKAEIEIHLIELHLADLQNDQKKFQEHIGYFQEQKLFGHIAEFTNKNTKAVVVQNALQLNVLGIVTVEKNQQPLKIRGRKRLECLAYLLETRVLGRNEATNADICQSLYPELSDTEAKAALKQLIFQLRAQLGADIVQSTNHGYALGTISSDLETFLANHDSGLWRGTYLSGLGVGWLSSVQETILYALKNKVEILAESQPQEAARLGTIWLEIEPYDLEALELTLRAHQNAGQTSSAKKVFNSTREQHLEVGMELPRSENDFLMQREISSSQA
jgi:DNA-binding SARP family transcriptional activator